LILQNQANLFDFLTYYDRSILHNTRFIIQNQRILLDFKESTELS